jgi:hypothetical protein
MAGVTTAEWFPGEGRRADDEAFLARLRSRAGAEGLVDVVPESTWALEASGITAACVRPPGLPVGRPAPVLQVGLARPARERILLGAWETWGYVLDLPEIIDITHVSPTPEGLADRAFRWLVEQLGRPVERLEWTSGRWPPRIELRLRHPDEPLALQRSGWPFRRRRAAPNRVVRLR